tara:strand:+ start:425 stop:610 length:186 start_codon:yes stop_codon:yes gene_type:complete
MNKPKDDTFHTVDQDFVRDASGEAVAQYCYQDDGKLFIRRRDTELNGKKLVRAQWRDWIEI